MDAYTTERAEHDVCHCYAEASLPHFISNHATTMYVYSFGVASLDTYVSAKLWQHGHRRLARIIPTIDVIVDGRSGLANIKALNDGRNFGPNVSHNKGGVGGSK